MVFSLFYRCLGTRRGQHSPTAPSHHRAQRRCRPLWVQNYQTSTRPAFTKVQINGRCTRVPTIRFKFTCNKGGVNIPLLYGPALLVMNSTFPVLLDYIYLGKNPKRENFVLLLHDDHMGTVGTTRRNLLRGIVRQVRLSIVVPLLATQTARCRTFRRSFETKRSPYASKVSERDMISHFHTAHIPISQSPDLECNSCTLPAHCSVS